MAQKINYEELVGNTYPSNHWGEFTLTEYMGKKLKKHLFKIRFLETDHEEELVAWDSIRKGSVTDTKARKIKTAETKKKNFFKRRQELKEQKQVSYSPPNLQDEAFLTVDLATKNVGVAYWNKCVLRNYKSINVDNSINTDGRNFIIAEEVLNTCKRVGVNLVVVEGIYLGDNVLTFETLAEARGILKATLRRENITTHIVPVAHWKSKLGIKGKREEQKAESIRQAEQFLFDPESEIPTKVNEDIADAINMGRALL